MKRFYQTTFILFVTLMLHSCNLSMQDKENMQPTSNSIVIEALSSPLKVERNRMVFNSWEDLYSTMLFFAKNRSQDKVFFFLIKRKIFKK